MLKQRNQLKSLEQIKAYLYGGRGMVTLQSHKTGAHLTFKFGVPEDRGERGPVFVRVLTGPDNESNYTYIGYLWGPNGGLSYFHGRRSRVTQEAPSVRAIRWFTRSLVAGRVPEGVDVYHEGVCGRCGRTLTVPESIESGNRPRLRAERRWRINFTFLRIPLDFYTGKVYTVSMVNKNNGAAMITFTKTTTNPAGTLRSVFVRYASKFEGARYLYSFERGKWKASEFLMDLYGLHWSSWATLREAKDAIRFAERTKNVGLGWL